MNPNIKTALSLAAVAVASAALVAIQKSLIPLAPESIQLVLVSAVTATAHYLDTWGTKQKKAELPTP